MNEPLHVAVTRRIKPGCEAEFQQALKEFFQTSFAHLGVQGASMLVPPPGSSSHEYGILRTFASARERDDFYASPMFRSWEEKVKPLTEGEPVRRQLNGLEAWFRSPQNPPPRWKMALLTWVAVWPVSMAVPAALYPLMGQRMPNVLFAGAVAGGIVLVLTWVAMPILVTLAKEWLSPQIKTTTKII
jgi:antibiotic biosynthesis monooxygenase (ABM) superfamily enzyme